MYCSSCGIGVSNDAAFCASCGMRVNASSSPAAALAATQAWPPGAGHRSSYEPNVTADSVHEREQAELASFGQRFGAWLIDSVVALIPAWIMAVVVGAVFGVLFGPSSTDSLTVAEQQAQTNQAVTVGAILGFAVVFFGYHWVTTAIGGGVGKRALGIEVVDEATLEAPEYGKAAGRVAMSLLSRLALWIGYLSAAWDETNQTWHDKAAGTLVVRREPRSTVVRTF